AKTPGRDEDTDLDSELLLSNKYVGGQAPMIIEALGGIDNIVEIDNCATRLRLTVKKANDVDINALKKSGAYNTFIRGKSIQVIYGPTVNLIKTEIDEYMEGNQSRIILDQNSNNPISH